MTSTNYYYSYKQTTRARI